MGTSILLHHQKKSWKRERTVKNLPKPDIRTLNVFAQLTRICGRRSRAVNLFVQHKVCIVNLCVSSIWDVFARNKLSCLLRKRLICLLYTYVFARAKSAVYSLNQSAVFVLYELWNRMCKYSFARPNVRKYWNHRDDEQKKGKKSLKMSCKFFFLNIFLRQTLSVLGTVLQNSYGGPTFSSNFSFLYFSRWLLRSIFVVVIV